MNNAFKHTVWAPVPAELKPALDKTDDAIVQAVQADLAARSRRGVSKYGVTLDRAGLDLRAWLQHAYEECLDQANYLKCAIVALDGGKK